MSKRITIIGSGAMGTMCALVLAGNGHDVIIWGRNKRQIKSIDDRRENSKYLRGFKLPENITLTNDITQACSLTDFFISAVPTQHIRSVWDKFAGQLPDNCAIVSVAKGIEQRSLLLPSQIIEQVVKDGGRDIEDAPRRARPTNAANFSLAALSGPSIALEIAQKKPATLCAASKDSGLAEKVQLLFSTNYLRIYTNSDILGVELAGATKNVIALAAGMLDGLQEGINAKSALLARGLAEITRLGIAMGARRETFFGVAGAGDLATTCFSPTGRNRNCGELLGKGYSLKDALEKSKGIVEGVSSSGAVMALAQKYNVEMPITEAVHNVLFKELPPVSAIKKLMTRSAKQSERIG